MTSSTPLRIVVTGLIAQHPDLGGVAWDYGQYVGGFADLGHDVFYIEDSGQWPYNDDVTAASEGWIASDCRRNVERLRSTMAHFGLDDDRWAYRFATTGEWFGMSDAMRVEVVRSADLVVNVSGCLEHPERYRGAGKLVYVDGDPLFTHVRYVAGTEQAGLDEEEERVARTFRRLLDAHDVHCTFAENAATIEPATGHRWLPTRQPVVLEQWRPDAVHDDRFTTVLSLTSYRPLELRGRSFGQKDVELRRFVELPSMVPGARFELATHAIRHPSWESDDALAAPQLGAMGWSLVDSAAACGDLGSYRAYIEGSGAEWSVAKHGYVAGRTGWFSGRSACYLAAGRPVVVQDTALPEAFPTGEGILTFTDLAGAADAVRSVRDDHQRHAKAARALAEELFDARRVLSDLIEDVS